MDEQEELVQGHAPFLVDTPAGASPGDHGHRQRHARLVLGRRAVSRRRRRDRARAAARRRGRGRSSTSAGESTRPGSDPGPGGRGAQARAAGRGASSRGGDARISIDTTKSAVARAALEAGATIVNDVSAFRFDPELPGVVAEAGADCCLMHMLGEPRTMQEDPRYDDVVSDVKRFPGGAARLRRRARGWPEERVWLDPGIGFGKTVEHNLELLRRLDEIVAIGRPVAIGTSRKSFLGKLAGGRDEGGAPCRERSPRTCWRWSGARPCSECTTSPRTPMPCGWPLRASAWMWEREPDDDFRRAGRRRARRRARRVLARRSR